LTQPPPTDAEKSLALQPIPSSFKSPFQDVIGETSKSVRQDEEVYAITIQNDPPLIERRHEHNHVQLKSVTCGELQSEESSFNTKGSDSDDPFDLVGRKLSVNGLVAMSPREKSQRSSLNTNGFHSERLSIREAINGHATISSGDASLGSIREAINSLELLMFKDLYEISSDPAIQSGLNQLLDVLNIKTVEVQKAIGEFKTKAFSSCQEFQSTVESLNKLKNYEKRLDGIRQETAASKGQWSALENSIATLKEQQDAKGRDLEQLVLNLKNKEATLSTYSTNCVSLNEQAQKLLEEAGYLLAARSEIEDGSESPEVKQNRLKSTWSSDITPHFSKIN
jgi:predicted  nucleic acid-binding Zn-ribbon protein